MNGKHIRPITPVVKPADQNQVVVEPKATTTGGGLRKVGIGVGAAGAVLGGLGIYFAMVSANKSNEIDGYTGTWDAEHMGIQSEGERAEKRAWLCGGLGVGAMIAGGVMYVIGGPKAVESNSVTLVPTRGGAAVGWSTRF